MAGTIEQKLAAQGIVLHEPASPVANYVGFVRTGNLLFAPGNPREAYFPKRSTGIVYSFGLPGEDEVSRMKSGNE